MRVGVSGFDRAWLLLIEHQARVGIQHAVAGFLDDARVVAAHIDTRAAFDATAVTGFDSAGRLLGSTSLHSLGADWCEDGRMLVREFNWRSSHAAPPPGSDLAERFEFGWVIDVDAVRLFDADLDRRRIQRQAAFAHLADMFANGAVQYFAITPELLESHMCSEVRERLTVAERACVIAEMMDDPRLEELITPVYDDLRDLMIEHAELVVAARPQASSPFDIW